MYLIHLKNWPILKQLQLEEALLRGHRENFCLINQGSSRAIVMGISGEPSKLLDVEKVKTSNIPVIKRFSGGGTVIVDENTLFITFILEKSFLDIPAFPEPILKWSASLYQKSWNIPGFHLRENDYCIGDKKCGGNAQYIQKDRFLHHTSFLWDYCPENMQHLLLPTKRPQYRQDRSHDAFLTRLKNHAPTPEMLIENFKQTIGGPEVNVKPQYNTPKNGAFCGGPEVNVKPQYNTPKNGAFCGGPEINVKPLYIELDEWEKWLEGDYRRATHIVPL